MAYLELNGVTVSVAVDSVSLRWVNAGGEEERSPSGSLEGGPLTLKREWAMATTPVPTSELDAWVGLIEGKGHVFPYDADLYSSRGRGTGSSSGSISIVTSGAKHGAGYLLLEASSFVTYDVSLPSGWTVFGWRRELSTPAFEHRVLRSDGSDWRDGVLGVGFDALEITVGSGVLAFTGADGGDWCFDDMASLPYAMPAAWVSGVYALHSAQAWSALPRLYASGDFTSSPVTVRGKVTDTRTVRYAPSGAITNGHTIQFTLREV